MFTRTRMFQAILVVPLSWIVQMRLCRCTGFAHSFASRFHSIAQDERRSVSREEFHRSITPSTREGLTALSSFYGDRSTQVQPSPRSFKPSPIVFSARGPAGEISRLSFILQCHRYQYRHLVSNTRPLVKSHHHQIRLPIESITVDQ